MFDANDVGDISNRSTTALAIARNNYNRDNRHDFSSNNDYDTRLSYARCRDDDDKGYCKYDLNSQTSEGNRDQDLLPQDDIFPFACV